LRKIFGSKKEGVTGDWRKLHREELQDLLLTKHYGDQMEDEVGWASGTHNARRILMGKPEERTRLQRFRHRWEEYKKSVSQKSDMGRRGLDSSG
jgi:hypothetical protein